MAMLPTFQRVRASFNSAIGDIVFGMEDGTVSIFGLVFGVAASTTSSHVVILAGATGAIAAAVSMMAGAYLDASSARDIARARIAEEIKEIESDPAGEEREVIERLRGAGFTPEDAQMLLGAIRRTPGAMLRFMQAFELRLGTAHEENPVERALWMFVADLIAAFVPVIPFMLFGIGPARIVSLVVTGLLLLALGIGRGLVAHKNVISTVVETLLIAAAAAVAGVVIGKIIESH